MGIHTAIGSFYCIFFHLDGRSIRSFYAAAISDERIELHNTVGKWNKSIVQYYCNSKRCMAVY